MPSKCWAWEPSPLFVRQVLDNPLWTINHVHVSIAAGKLIEHLRQSLFLSFFLFGASDPANVIVLLVRRATAICLHYSMLNKCLSDELRHRIARPL